MYHRKTSSMPDLKFRESRINKIISDCNTAKKDIIGSFTKINKQLSSQKTGWSKIQNSLLPSYYSPKSFNKEETQNLKKKLKSISEKQATQKVRKLSKFYFYDKATQIAESDFSNQETLRFFSLNKRTFGSPLQEILFFNKNQGVKKEKKLLKAKTSQKKSLFLKHIEKIVPSSLLLPY